MRLQESQFKEKKTSFYIETESTFTAEINPKSQIRIQSSDTTRPNGYKYYIPEGKFLSLIHRQISGFGGKKTGKSTFKKINFERIMIKQQKLLIWFKKIPIAS